MDAGGRDASGGWWGTAVGLTLAVLLLSVLDAVPLVAVPLALLLVALPSERRVRGIALGLVVWALALLVPGGSLIGLSRGWALLLGGSFLLVSVLRPQWGVLPRALLALALTCGATLTGLAASGAWGQIDAVVREHFRTASTLTLEALRPEGADSTWAQNLGVTAQRVATLQWTLFPAVLGLQSLAALGLASWWVARIRRGERSAIFRLRPLREFRFNDQLVWVVVAGLALLALPLGALANRVGFNALFFMGGLYALRGVGVFVFLAGGAPSILAILFGVLAAVFLYPVVLTTVVLVGLGDTWLDVRGRASPAPPA